MDIGPVQVFGINEKGQFIGYEYLYPNDEIKYQYLNKPIDLPNLKELNHVPIPDEIGIIGAPVPVVIRDDIEPSDTKTEDKVKHIFYRTRWIPYQGRVRVYFSNLSTYSWDTVSYGKVTITTEILNGMRWIKMLTVKGYTYNFNRNILHGKFNYIGPVTWLGYSGYSVYSESNLILNIENGYITGFNSNELDGTIKPVPFKGFDEFMIWDSSYAQKIFDLDKLINISSGEFFFLNEVAYIYNERKEGPSRGYIIKDDIGKVNKYYLSGHVVDANTYYTKMMNLALPDTLTNLLFPGCKCNDIMQIINEYDNFELKYLVDTFPAYLRKHQKFYPRLLKVADVIEKYR